ncbi:MAG: MFS transporter [Phycisphaerae bacterium]|nr:MFS transporter [Phycisphaerae bacterium]
MPTPARRDPLEAVRLPNYRWFALGFVASATGLQMLGFTVLWELWERTRDPFAVGLGGLARAGPVVLLALLSGHAADVYSRRVIVALTNSGFALCAIALAGISIAHAPVWGMYLLLILTGVCRSFNGPARNSILPLLVPGETLHNAVTWNSGLFQFAAIAGPFLAGVMLQHARAPWMVYVVTAVLCLVFAAICPLLRPRVVARHAEPLSLASMLAGARFIRREEVVFGAILLDLLAVLFGGVTALLPQFAEQILHTGPVGLAALRAAPYVGALVMAVVLAYRPPFERSGRALLWSVAGFGACTVVFGFSTSLWLSLAALFVAGALDNISVVVRHVLIQVRTPDHLRGRVGAVNSLFIECSNELGSFESGLVARLLGPVVSAVSGGVGTLAVVSGIAFGFPALRRLGRLHATDEAHNP